ncbi:hypothetical protein GCM10020370_40780 [Paenibacillus hodogayensis]
MPTGSEIKGTIIPNDYQWIYDLFEIEATSPGKIARAVTDANGDDLEVAIISGGRHDQNRRGSRKRDCDVR